MVGRDWTIAALISETSWLDSKQSGKLIHGQALQSLLMVISGFLSWDQIRIQVLRCFHCYFISLRCGYLLILEPLGYRELPLAHKGTTL